MRQRELDNDHGSGSIRTLRERIEAGELPNIHLVEEPEGVTHVLFIGKPEEKPTSSDESGRSA